MMKSVLTVLDLYVRHFQNDASYTIIHSTGKIIL